MPVSKNARFLGSGYRQIPFSVYREGSLAGELAIGGASHWYSEIECSSKRAAQSLAKALTEAFGKRCKIYKWVDTFAVWPRTGAFYPIGDNRHWLFVDYEGKPVVSMLSVTGQHGHFRWEVTPAKLLQGFDIQAEAARFLLPLPEDVGGQPFWAEALARAQKWINRSFTTEIPDVWLALDAHLSLGLSIYPDQWTTRWQHVVFPQHWRCWVGRQARQGDHYEEEWVFLTPRRGSLQVVLIERNLATHEGRWQLLHQTEGLRPLGSKAEARESALALLQSLL